MTTLSKIQKSSFLLLFSAFVFLGVYIIFFPPPEKGRYPDLNKLEAQIIFENNVKETISVELNSGKMMGQIKKRAKRRGVGVSFVEISGKILINKSQPYDLAVWYSQPVSFFIDGNSIIDNTSPRNSKNLFLQQGLHNFRMRFIPDMTGDGVVVLWKKNPEEGWDTIGKDHFFSHQARGYSPAWLQEYQKNARMSQTVPFFVVYLFSLLFLFFIFISSRQKPPEPGDNPLSVRSRSALDRIRQQFPSRITEIDVTKGFAGFLMVLAHCPGGNSLFPFGNFGAALFFFCSGMNTILFLDKRRAARGLTLYNLFFIVLLFFGGYTQILIVHPQLNRIIAEFFQFYALGILLIYVLFKILRDSRVIGYLFFLPFVIHLGYTSGLIPLKSVNLYWSQFFFGDLGFTLFPWGGYLLYGILILGVRKNRRVFMTVLVLTGSAALFSITILNIPVSRHRMSLSYMLLSLFVLAFLFYGFSRLLSMVRSIFFSSVLVNLAMVGRNSLMLVYLHYFVLGYLIPRIPDPVPILELLFHAFIAFVFCIFFIFIYEKIKWDESLFRPALLIAFFLVVFRFGHLFTVSRNTRLIDMLLGILFAFLYVELRRKLRYILKQPHLSGV